MVGAGVYAGVGLSGQGAPGTVPAGINTTTTLHAELNAGVGIGGSLMVDAAPNGDWAGGGYHSQLPAARVGAAAGLAAGVGVGTTTTIGAPTSVSCW